MRQEYRDAGIVVALALVLGACIAVIALTRPGGASGAGEGTPPARDLRLAPWAAQPEGAPIIDEADGWGSLIFPAGVSYPAALRQLYVASRTDGQIPEGVTLAGELPAEVVVVEPAHQATGIRVSLRAPWGWTAATRRVRAPSLRLPADAPPNERRRLVAAAMTPTDGMPADVHLDVPQLAACQISTGTPQERPSCD